MEKLKAAQRAKKYFIESGSCGYSIVKALKEEYTKLNDINELMLEGFGGGFAATGKMCGVYSAATAIISHLYMTELTVEKRVELYTMLKECYNKIQRGYTSRTCKDICGCDFSEEADVNKYYDVVMDSICTKIVHDATEVIQEYIK